MSKERITSWRSSEHGPSPASREMEQYSKRLIREFGRDDLTSGVQAAVRNEARAQRISSKEALARLISEAGSLDLLAAKIRKDSRRLRRKRNKQRATAREKARAGGVALPQSHVTFVNGGGPGLGGARKPMQVPPRKT